MTLPKATVSTILLLGAISTPVLGADTLRLCTGSPGKTYHAVGEKLAELLPELSANALQVEVIATGGSIDNLTKLVEGECDAAIAQGDAVAFFVDHVREDAADAFKLHTPLFKELSLLLCSEDSGVDEIEDLLDLDNPVVAAGAMGSGSLATWLTFRAIKPEYEQVKVMPQNGAEGAMAVANGEASCVFEVIAPQSDFVQALNDNETIADGIGFAEVDDDFSGHEIDGQEIYSRVEFDDERYDNISSWGDPELVAIMAYLVVGNEWSKAHTAGMNALSMGMLTGKADIEGVAYGAEKPFSE